MTNQPPLAGLCRFDDPELWFGHTVRDVTRAKRICGNCPVRLACAEAALDLEVTDGVWAGVRMPGAKYIDPLAQARERLGQVIEAARLEPDSHRRRCLAIRAAVYHSHVIERSRAGA